MNEKRGTGNGKEKEEVTGNGERETRNGKRETGKKNKKK